MDKKNDIEFDLIELLLYMKKRLWIVVLTVVIFTMGGYLASKLLITPTYTARAQVYIVYDVKADENAEVSEQLDDDYTQQLMANQIRNDCVVLLSSRNVTSTVIQNLGLNMSAGGLSSQLVIEAEENTRILNISITDTDPQRAARIVNEVCNVGKAWMASELDVDVVRVVEYADVPGAPSSPSPSRNATVAAILGLVAAISIMVIVFLMDDSIRNESDIEHYLGLSTLAEIPVSAELMSQKGGELRSVRGRLRGIRK